jgi:hypothetical protein
MKTSHAMKLRWFFVGALVAFVILAGVAIYQRSDDAPKATRDLPYNHRVEAADIALEKTQPLVGQYLRRKVAAGATIEPSNLSPAPLPLLPADQVATVAAVLSMAASDNLKLGNKEEVKVKLKGSSDAIPGKAVWRDCNATRCTVVVALEAPLPASAAASGAFLGAEVLAR